MSLSAEEFKHLRKAILSPLLSTNPRVEQLYRYLRPFFPEFKDSKLSKAYLYARIFPNEAYKDGKMRKLITEFTQVVEDFLIYLELEKQRFQRQKYLTEIYNKRQLYDFFKKNTAVLLKELAQSSYQGETIYKNQMELLQAYFFHPSTSKTKDKTEVLNSLQQHLDNFYFTSKLRLASDIINRSQFLKEEQEIPFLKFLKNYLSEQTNLPLIVTFYLEILHLLKTREVASYWKIRNSFFKNIQALGQEDKKVILLHLLNFAIGQVNKGEHLFRMENFELYKFALQHNLLIENNSISDIAFTNIASYGASLEEFEWTHQFIQDYQPFLVKTFREEATQLSWAYLAFFQKDYTTTINLLLCVPFNKISHKRRGKGLLLRSYFEMALKDSSYQDLFFSYAHSYQKALYRNNIDANPKIQQYLNLIKYLKRIAALVNTYQWKPQIKKEILVAIEAENMVLKPWLLERLKIL